MSAVSTPESSTPSVTRRSLLHVERWDEFDEVYRPFVAKYLRVLRDKHKVDLSADDVDELQERIMVRVYQRLPGYVAPSDEKQPKAFEHRGGAGQFRKWLFLVTKSCLWDYLKNNPAIGGSAGHAMMEELEDSIGALNDLWDQEYHRHILRRMFERVAHEFEPNTWAAFLLVTLEEHSADDASKKLGITANAVRIAKARVMRRLREVAPDLLDSGIDLPGVPA